MMEKINSKENYYIFLEHDRLALGIKQKKPRLFGDEIWKLERVLRKMEY